MALDETGELQSLVESFVSEEDMSTRMGIVEDILWFICDANSVSQYSRGSNIDARKLKVIESFMGQDFMGVNGAMFGNRNYDGCKVAY